MKNILITITIFILSFKVEAKHPFNHGLWNQVLMNNVSSEGKVNYMGIKNDLNFKKYITITGVNPPQDFWTPEEKMTYWINVYNAYTVKLIIDNYPVKSIKDIGTPSQGPWDKKFIKIGEKMYSLNDIEHQILRKQFDDPRIHFAIVCASFSCPNLRNEAFFVDNLETQLNDQAEKFINNKAKNNITTSSAQISELFSWFKDDFTKKGTLIEFINKYSSVKITSKTKISYMTYDWSLNNMK